jgi:hypothetical protein
MLADGQDVLAHATLCELRIGGSDRLEDAAENNIAWRGSGALPARERLR